MSGSQSENGKAFEFACLNSLYRALSKIGDVEIVNSSQLNTAKDFFENIDERIKNNLVSAADAASRVIVRLEPQLQYEQTNKPLYITIQTDSTGMSGDVRDVVCIRRQNSWEIGISCKHNHHAVKHSRLSATIDFGKEWMNIPCSENYFSKIVPIFNELAEIKKKSQNAGSPKKWSDIPDKVEKDDKPILTHFMEELKHLNETNKDVPALLIQYLLGKYDFYKVISDDSHKITRVEAINIHGTLNRPSGKQHSIVDIQKIKLPTKFFNIDFKEDSDTTIEVTCNNGWGVSMRIHNASTNVEPSLKFDVQLISLPPAIYSQVEPW